MSKSKLNGVDPQDMIDRYGADAARHVRDVRVAAGAARSNGRPMASRAAHRFLRRLWTFAQTQARRRHAAAPPKATPRRCRGSRATRAAKSTSR